MVFGGFTSCVTNLCPSFRLGIFHWNYSEDHLHNNFNNHLKIHYSGWQEMKQTFSNKQFAINYSITSNQKCIAWRQVDKNIPKHHLNCYIYERNHVRPVNKMNFPRNPGTFSFCFGEQWFRYQFVWQGALASRSSSCLTVRKKKQWAGSGASYTSIYNRMTEPENGLGWKTP